MKSFSAAEGQWWWRRLESPSRGGDARLVEEVAGGRLRVRTSPGPRTGLVGKIVDPLDLIHALTTRIPDPGQHPVRCCGRNSSRS